MALKIIKPGMDSRDIVARFEAERQTLALMDHTNIARILDGGTTPQGRPYFVMELIRGVPITEYCDTNRLSVLERARLFIDVCKAVQHAHQRGIIHRDIKPSNVLVTLHDNAPVPKVIDFGVAKAFTQHLTDKTIYTRVHAAIGTLAYMAPEQAALTNQDIDTRADVYGLGALLYELLTGTTPIDSQRLERAALDEAIRIIREEEPPRASTKLSSLGATATAVSAKRQTDPAGLQSLVRGELDWVLHKALEKDRNRRYESASALATDLQRLLDHEPVEACPPSLVYRTRKLIRRNRGAVAAAAALGFALLIGIAGTTTGWRAATRKANELTTLLSKHREEVFQHALADVLAATPDAQSRIESLDDLDVEPERLELLQGLSAFYRGEPDLAVSRLQAALERRADSVAAKAALAMASENAGEYDRWRRLVYELHAQQPESPEDHLFLAQALMVIGNPEWAVQLAKTAISEYPSQHALATLVRAKAWRALIVTGNMEDAEQAATDIVSVQNIYPDSPYVLECGLFAHVVAMIIAGPDQPNYGHLLAQAERFAAMLQQQFPRYPYGRLYHAVLLDLTGRAEEAEEQYRVLVSTISPNENWKAWHALLQYRNGKQAQALNTIRTLSPSAMMHAAPLLCDTAADRQLVIQSVRAAGEGARDDFAGDYHIRALLFVNQRSEARRLAKQALDTLVANNAKLATWQDWEKQKLRFYVEELDAAQLLAAAAQSPILLCDAHSLIAADHYALGNFAEACRHFHATVETRVTWWSFYLVAIIFLERLETDAHSQAKSQFRHCSPCQQWRLSLRCA